MGFPYNTPTYIGGIVVTKYRQNPSPAEIKRIKAVAKQLARDHSDVWYWDWKTRRRVQV